MAYAQAADGQYELFAAPQPKRLRGVFSRLMDRIVEGRRHVAEREIVAYLEGSGKFLTDEAEREIERILSSACI
jgi:hypothetical protein